MAPLPCLRIWSNSYFIQLQTLRRLMAITRSNSSPVESAISTAGLCTPALLKAASSLPNVEIVWSTIAFTCASSATSQRSASTLWPAAASSAAGARTEASWISAIATAAPDSAKAFAAASPIPAPAPVTRATLFSNGRFMYAFLYLWMFFRPGAHFLKVAFVVSGFLVELVQIVFEFGSVHLLGPFARFDFFHCHGNRLLAVVQDVHHILRYRLGQARFLLLGLTGPQFHNHMGHRSLLISFWFRAARP